MFLRFFRWIIQKLGSRNLIALTLLFVAVGSTAYGLSDIIRGLDRELIFRLILLAIILSWLFARTKIPTWLAALLLFVSGVLILIISVSHLIGPLLAFSKAAGYLSWAYLTRTQDIPLDLTTINLAYAEVYFGVAEVLEALWGWILSIVEDIPLYDEIAISMVWGMVFWLIAAWAGWVMRRNRKAILSVLPTAVLLSATLSYSWASTATLVPLMLATLLLAAFVNYDLNEKSWLFAKMDYPEDLAKEFAMTSVGVVIGIVAIATFLPIFSIHNIVDFIEQFTEPQIREAQPVIQSFGLEQGSIPREDIGRALQGGLPRSHLMGSGPELAEQVVMTVALTAGIPRDGRRYLNLPLYWRSLTYDEYMGVGWGSTDVVMRSYSAGENVVTKESPFHQAIQQDVRMARGETRFLYAAGDILTADDDFKIAYRPTPRYTEVLDAHGDFFGASIDESTYRVQSLIPIVSEEDLRAAQGEYPGWVIERYLALPDSIPTRVFRLSQELTQNDPTVYDKARKIEKYLRSFEYTLDVELPPLRQDMVDYFLFDLRKGYCDYYASSMVVMLRGLGIPTRIAIGYYWGIYDDINNRYIVTEADAHSWVEVYFPQIGWVPFEPTAGRTEIDRLAQNLFIPDDMGAVQPLNSLSPRLRGFSWYWLNVLVIVVGGVALLILGAFVIDNARIHSFSPIKAMTQLYQRLYRLGRGLKVPVKKGDTPLEFVQNLDKRLAMLFVHSVFDKQYTKVTTEINEFTSVYIRMMYSSRILTMPDRAVVINLWQRIRRKLWLARFLQFTHRFTMKAKPKSLGDKP